MVATVQYAMFTFAGNLVGYIHATVTQDAARHVQLNKGTNIYTFERAAFKLIAGGFGSMLKA